MSNKQNCFFYPTKYFIFIQKNNIAEIFSIKKYSTFVL